MNDNPYQPPRRVPAGQIEMAPALRASQAVAIKSVGVFSLGKMLGALYALLGLLVGALFSLFSIIGVAAGARNAGPAALLVGVGAIIFVPVFYGLIGFVGGMIVAVLYNVVASIAGGVEIELKSSDDRAP